MPPIAKPDSGKTCRLFLFRYTDPEMQTVR